MKESFELEKVKPEVGRIIKELKSGNIGLDNIPSELTMNIDAVKVERLLGLRKSGLRGFDVINNYFFVEEEHFYKDWRGELYSKPNKTIFNSFEEYYIFLDGDIYKDACYYNYNFEDKFIKYNNIDVDKLRLRNCFIEYSIEDIYLSHKKTKSKTTRVINKKYQNSNFYVTLTWIDKNKKVVDKHEEKFTYFCDFVAFLKGDLSDADLIFCDGLKNLFNIDGINLSNAKMRSCLCDKFGISYKPYKNSENSISDFAITKINEEETEAQLQILRKELQSNTEINQQDMTMKIAYISDLHLTHRIKNAGYKSKYDVIYTLQKIVDNILDECSKLTLIGGDVSSDFNLFKLFIETLSKSRDLLETKKEFVFVLGNHELWSFNGTSLDDIVKRYRKLLDKNHMYLLQNDLLHTNLYGGINVIPYEELIEDNEKISTKLKYSNLVILGGIGFSGKNEEFNANSGVYQTTIDRDTEIQESNKFEQLYMKLNNVLKNRNTIIFTHMPKKDWDSKKAYECGFVYVSGHTHKNEFFDDGVNRVYADNQIGYNDKDVHVKNFIISKECDCFGDFDDGIHKIRAQEYLTFLQLKNIRATFDNKSKDLYMLKNNSYYCFIYKKDSGDLYILSGGAKKKLNRNDIEYYYKNMNLMINIIEKPLRKYANYQEYIANKIKEIGGSGLIHGCIIDIDFYNHVYVNPTDMTVRSYWAQDIVEKEIYPTFTMLLKAKCPVLYDNYLKLIGDGDTLFNNNQTDKEVESLPELYLETDIYRVSREIKKMQKLHSNILTSWYDDALKKTIEIEM